MRSPATRARAALTLAGLAMAAVVAAAPVAAASGTAVPFQDGNIRGSLTFCNRSNQPVTSGSLYTAPFAWKVISSAAPPAGYRGRRARATLYAYQPIDHVEPVDWSGAELTAASAFSNTQHPVVQATNADLPLLFFVQTYPPYWDGLEEIRMMYTADGRAQLQAPYAAAIVRITGNTWTLVEGGGGSCAQGLGASVETVLLPKKELAHPRTVVAAGKSPGPAKTTRKSASTGSRGARLAASSSRTAGVGLLLWVALAAVALAVVVTAVIASRLRRRAAPLGEG
jgi:hypothetical protein